MVIASLRDAKEKYAFPLKISRLEHMVMSSTFHFLDDKEEKKKSSDQC